MWVLVVGPPPSPAPPLFPTDTASSQAWLQGAGPQTNQTLVGEIPEATRRIALRLSRLLGCWPLAVGSVAVGCRRRAAVWTDPSNALAPLSPKNPPGFPLAAISAADQSCKLLRFVTGAHT